MDDFIFGVRGIDTIPEFQNMPSGAERELQMLAKEVDTVFQSKVSNFKDQIAKLEKIKKMQKKEVADANEALKSAQANCNHLSEENSRLKDNLLSTQEENKSLKNSLTRLNEKYEILHQKFIESTSVQQSTSGENYQNKAAIPDITYLISEYLKQNDNDCHHFSKEMMKCIEDIKSQLD